MTGATEAGSPRSGALVGVSCHPTYDRVSIERELAEAESERVRLLAELVSAQSQLAAATHERVVRASQERGALAALARAAEAEITRLEDEHHHAVESIRAAAADEVSTILGSVGASSSTISRPPVEPEVQP